MAGGHLNPVLALTIPPRVFSRMPRRILAPFLEVGIGALWQVVAPCRFERCFDIP
jgi:hypothetical protein